MSFVLELALYVIAADLAWVGLTQAMWALDAWRARARNQGGRA